METMYKAMTHILALGFSQRHQSRSASAPMQKAEMLIASQDEPPHAGSRQHVDETKDANPCKSPGGAGMMRLHKR